jgi:hypothetical protein
MVCVSAQVCIKLQVLYMGNNAVSRLEGVES